MIFFENFKKVENCDHDDCKKKTVRDHLQCMIDAKAEPEESGFGPAGEAKFRVFQPKTRVYFDTGTDDEGEVDIFKDGALTPTINLLEPCIDPFDIRVD